LKKKNLIVFDIDGTLTDSVTIHKDAFIRALSLMGVEYDASALREFKHYTDSFIAKSVFEEAMKIPFTEGRMNEFSRHLQAGIIEEMIDEIDGAKQVVKALERESDFGVCFATGSIRKAAVYKLDSIGIGFDKRQLVASDRIHERERIVQLAINQASHVYKTPKFERIISIGDGVWDLNTAKALGLEFIGIGERNRADMAKQGTISHYTDLTQLLGNLDGEHLTK
jgi:phosphoglycolate phosphatase-like HAD superfamily hydrolase